MPTKPCPFCHLGPERIAGSNATGLIVRDAYPVTPNELERLLSNAETLTLTKRQTPSDSQ